MVVFQNQAVFDKTIFAGEAWFGAATFKGVVSFDGATFQGRAWFGEATFTGDTGLGVAGAEVLHVDDPDINNDRVWPNGCTVRPDPANPSRGTLVRAEHGQEPEQAVPPPDPTGR